MITEYKYITDNYCWLDESEGESMHSESAKSKQSPKIYGLRTPLKASRKSNIISDMSLDMGSNFDNAKDGMKRGKEASTSTKLD